MNVVRTQKRQRGRRAARISARNHGLERGTLSVPGVLGVLPRTSKGKSSAVTASKRSSDKTSAKRSREQEPESDLEQESGGPSQASDSDPNDEREPEALEPVQAELVERDEEADDDEEPAEEEADTDEEVESAPQIDTTKLERVDAMTSYLREVQRHPLLTVEETHELAVRFAKTQDPKAAAKLVTSNLRLVVKIAYEYRRAYKNIMDLVQEGNIGLMQAVKRYDPYRGVKLSSYSAWWIRAYILRFILNNWRLVKLGTTQAQRKLFFNLRKKRAELQALGIDPSDAEVAKQLNVPESDVREMEIRLQASEKSLDAPVGDADGRSIAKIDMMPALGAGPEAMMADGELQAMLKDKLAAFRTTLEGKEKELAIFDERLIADDPLTLQDLGDRFGISRERVRQLEQRLMGRLRDFLKREMGDATEVV
jgi:RNA polymerase sigma-32 factor